MHYCIGVPAAELRLESASPRVVVVHCWSYTERQWVAEVVETAGLSGAGFAQALAAFTSRMKAHSQIASAQGAECPFLFGVSRG